MKKFTIKQNKYLAQDIQGYYNQDYVGYQKEGNPDFINHLKNMSKTYSEIDLVQDFIDVADKFSKNIEQIIEKNFFKLQYYYSATFEKRKLLFTKSTDV
ncbi:MAG: hypothetical protein RR400_03020 [Clostridia bacterium]